jgi:hypothetical protein
MSVASQVAGRGQRACGLNVGRRRSPLQCAHRMDREARNRGELLLREARRLAERFELRAK